jgi:hypothetical protein
VLLAAGASVDMREHKWQATPMGWACHLDRVPAAERLAPHTRDVRALARSGRVARLNEVLASDPSLANHRLADAEEPTPLFCLPDDEEAATAVAQLLLAYGADTSMRDVRGQRADQVALARGLDEAAEVIRTPR